MPTGTIDRNIIIRQIAQNIAIDERKTYPEGKEEAMKIMAILDRAMRPYGGKIVLVLSEAAES